MGQQDSSCLKAPNSRKPVRQSDQQAKLPLISSLRSVSSIRKETRKRKRKRIEYYRRRRRRRRRIQREKKKRTHWLADGLAGAPLYYFAAIVGVLNGLRECVPAGIGCCCCCCFFLFLQDFRALVIGLL